MGLYVVAQSISNLLNVVPSAINSVLMPKATGKDNQQIHHLTGVALRCTFTVLMVSGLFLYACGSPVLSLVYGHKFDGAAPVLHILLIESILDGMTSVSSQAFLAAGFTGVVTLLQGCGLISAVPLMYWMVPRFGLRGAAFALVLSTSFRLAFVLLSFPMRLKMKPPSIILRPSDIRAIKATM